MNINFKLLHTFLIAAEKESFKRAADETHRSPSAITMQMRDLEAQLGVALFLRSPGHVTLTKEGRLLLDQVRGAMAEIHGALETMSRIAVEKKEIISIACAPTLASTRLPSILSSFKARFPKVQVNLREVTTADALEMLRNQDIELFVGPEIADLADFKFDPIVEDPLFACFPSALYDGRRETYLADLADLPIILLSHPTAVRGMIDKLAADHGLTLNVQFEVQQAVTAISLAAANLGVALLPQIAVGHAASLQLQTIPVMDHGATRQIGIATLRGAAPSPFAAQLISTIGDDLPWPSTAAGGSRPQL